VDGYIVLPFLNLDILYKQLEENKDVETPAQIKQDEFQISHHGTANSTEQQSPDECSVQRPIIDHPTQLDFTPGLLTVPGLMATVHSPKAPSAKRSSSESIKSVYESDQDSKDENRSTQISTKQPPAQDIQQQKSLATYRKLTLTTELVTDLFNTKKICAEQPSPKDECLSKKTPAQITKPSKGHHNRGQSPTSGTEKKTQKKWNERKPKNKLTPWR
jgi:hypothetical protein